MISTMRSKFGPIVIGSIIGLIAFVFIFYGIFMPGRGSGGLGSNAAGEVNGETISYTEFSRSLNQRIEFLKGMMGGKIDEDQLAKFGVREAVFKDLARRKLLVQIAKKEGFYPSAEQVREQILSMDVFKKEGRFDKVHYKQVLSQNQYTPARFEELIAQDLVEQQFKAFIASMAVVSPDSVELELKKSKERRKLRYVYLDHESVRKVILKGKKPTDIKPDDLNKQLNAKVEELAKALEPMVGAGQDKKIDAFLKDYGLKAKVSDWLNSQTDFIAGVGSIHSVHDDLFAAKKGDKAKKFSLMGGTLVAAVSEAEYYDPAKVTAKEKTDTVARLQNQKQNDLAEQLLKFWMSKATINQNNAVVVGGKGGSGPMPMDN